ncbi:substrate-binding domain-containing protein [Kibdelosporangium philippinense]|uniref:Substrate-binding domain-containing protein n=1 Tax=Kibdelosporangium philippinense TaxID=211113 RepID=A0ABS8ZD64_9PSEU|nr:substrate-binding domain-containing protein [Kibdelosporangium philippinense]MCE7004458.1 substrate-binding domain-containing protein [Kibdelosporangium philippinense]
MRQPGSVRRQRILAMVSSRGAARVSDLAEELEVSIVTARRDVEELARAGKLRRGHGVARSIVPVETPADPVPADERAIAIMVPERHTYLYETLHGARSTLEEAGMRVVLHITPKDTGVEQSLAERALADNPQGLLIAPRWRTAEDQEAAWTWLGDVGVPMVIMERRPLTGSMLHAVDSVCSDHWYGVCLAVEHLVGLGHRRIVLAARDDSPTARAIRAAFVQIVADRPEIEDATVVLSSRGAGIDPAQEPPDFAGVLREHRATAAILHGDEDALMLVQQLAEAGIRVPQDCSVVAYDDVVAALGSTPLTAVAPPKAEVGRVAAELLLERLSRPGWGRPRRIELLPDLTVRGSTDRLTD